MPSTPATVSANAGAQPATTTTTGGTSQRQQPDIPTGLSEATAIRLFNTVVATSAQDAQMGGLTPLSPPIRAEKTTNTTATTTTPLSPHPSQTLVNLVKSMESVQSLNYCRICRYNRSDYQILECPCLCKGSVGYIHLQCLKRWILQRRDNHCEICQSIFRIPEEKLSITRMFKSFMTMRCCGAIFKHILCSASLAPLAHVVLHQLLLCMDNINESTNEVLTVQEVLLCSCALLTSSALFFHYFEYVATRMIVIRNILRQWWMFGNSPDFAIVDADDVEPFEFM